MRYAPFETLVELMLLLSWYMYITMTLQVCNK